MHGIVPKWAGYIGRIFSHVRPFYESAVSDLDPICIDLIHRRVTHTTKNTASGVGKLALSRQTAGSL